MNTRQKMAALALLPALSAVAYVGSAFAADSTTTPPTTPSATHVWGGHRGPPRDDTQFAADLAQVLGLNAADVKAKLDAGTKPKDIITQAGKTEADVQAQMKTLHENEMKARLAAQVTSGKITQAQADAILANMANKTSGPMKGFGMHKGGPGETKHLASLAVALNMSTTDLQTALASGKTITDLATAQGMTAAQLKAKLDAARPKDLNGNQLPWFHNHSHTNTTPTTSTSTQ
jgi:hypothetical protein